MGAVILLFDKTDFKSKSVMKDKEEHLRIIKGSIQQKDNLGSSLV